MGSGAARQTLWNSDSISVISVCQKKDSRINALEFAEHLAHWNTIFGRLC